MHPLIAYDIARTKMADLDAEVDRDRLAAAVRPSRQKTDRRPLIPGRWALRRLFARLHLAGSGA